MSKIYFDAMRILMDGGSRVYHGGGYFGFTLLNGIVDYIKNREGIELVIIWKDGYKPVTDLEKQLMHKIKDLQNINSADEDQICVPKFEYAKTLSEVEFQSNSILFMPLFYYLDNETCDELKIVKKKYAIKTVAVIHDVRIFENKIFDIYNRFYSASKFHFLAGYVKGLLQVINAKKILKNLPDFIDKIYTVSNYSQQQLMHHTKIKNISWYYQKINMSYKPISPTNIYIPEKEFVLFVSGNTRVKNFARTLDAYLDALKDGKIEYKLYVTGNIDAIHDIIERVAGNRKTICLENVHCLGFVNENEMQWLYSNCRFLLYTSKYEGFGLPACNALLYGTPIIASNVTSIPEVCGGAAYYVNPYDKDSIKNGIIAMSEDAIYDRYKKYADDYKPLLQGLIKYGSEIMIKNISEET